MKKLLLVGIAMLFGWNATAEPLYFTCTGTETVKRGKDPTPDSWPTTASVLLDVEGRRFGWTENTGMAIIPTVRASCKDPKTHIENDYAYSTICSDASASDLRYSFSVEEDWTIRECSKTSCDVKTASYYMLTGHIDRLTGQLEAKEGYSWYYGWTEDFEKRTDREWHLTCTKADKQF
jgi:hypothetical protein